MRRNKLGVLLIGMALAIASPAASFAEERAATQEEINRVKENGKSEMQWEKHEETWRLLYLAVNAKEWKYATGWVRITKNGETRYYYMEPEGDMAETWTCQDGKWYFAVRDNYWRDKADAGKIVTGWAKIPDINNEYHVFYFGAADNGRPTGMYEDTTAVIDGVSYTFDKNGYCKNPPKGITIPKYSLKRTV